MSRDRFYQFQGIIHQRVIPMERKLEIPPPVLSKDNNISQDPEKQPSSKSITSAIVDESLYWIILLIVAPVASVAIVSGVALIWVMGMLILGY